MPVGEIHIMINKQRILIVIFSVLVFSISAAAQVAPDSLLLTVLDSANKPIANAEVRTVEGEMKNKRTLFTDENGKTEFFLPYQSQRNGDLNSSYTISKDGYFSFQDFGGSGYGAVVELLKIPETDAERRTVGEEQRKREFMWAAKFGDAATIAEMLRENIDPHLKIGDLRGVPGNREIPAILLAASSGSAETIALFLNAGIRVESKDSVVRDILTIYLNADPFQRRAPKNEKERREILSAYENGVAALLKAGADHTHPSSGIRHWPITLAAEKGYVRAFALLLEKGIPSGVENMGRRTLFEYAADGDWEGKTSKIEIVEFLLKKGFDPETECSSALLIASHRGDLPVVRALIKHGAKPDSRCGSALKNAVASKRTETARFLIEAGADKRILDDRGRTLLMTAVGNEDLATVKMLIEKRFPVNARDSSGADALIIGLRSAVNKDAEILEVLLKAGADPNAVSVSELYGCVTPLILTTIESRTELMKLLLAGGANINLACGGGDGRKTALSAAVNKGYSRIVKWLIETGADLDDKAVDKALESLKTSKSPPANSQRTIRLIEAARARRWI